MRILWLAVADARGHLMRAHVMRRALAARGVTVDIVTTSPEGVAFLAALGTPAARIDGGHRIVCDERQNLRRGRTEAGVLRYLVSPARGFGDLRRLSELARGAELVIDDSLHPALMTAPLRRRSFRVVHLYGENTLHAVEHALARDPRRTRRRVFRRRPGSLIEDSSAAAVRGLLRRGFARIEHTLSAPASGDLDLASRSFRLPPIVAAPERSPAEVRTSLGLAPDRKLAIVYLNPYFRDPLLAEAIEGALAAKGFAMHAVGEGYTGRPGWTPRDPRLADAIAAADLLISAAGMGALAAARTFGTPLLAVGTDQPEQARNLAQLAERPGGPGHPLAIARAAGSAAELRAGIDAAIAEIGKAPRRAPEDPREAAEALHDLWASAILALVAEARREGVSNERTTGRGARRREARSWMTL